MTHYLKICCLVLSVSILSCSTDLQEVNLDPNTTQTASDADILSSALGYLAYIIDADLNAESFIWAQYYTWGQGVSIGNAERFIVDPRDKDGYWERAYAVVLQDLDFLSGSESAAYRGVASILKAYTYQGLVDHFGDVPFTEATSYDPISGEILFPKFDDALSIYNNLLLLIDHGILELKEGEPDEIGFGDHIYYGNIDQWLKFANSLKLRILLRLSEVDPRNEEVLNVLNNGLFIENEMDLAKIQFEGAPANHNPMYAKFESGVGNFYFASNATLNVLQKLYDPRGAYFYSASINPNKELNGIDQGSVDDLTIDAQPTWWSMSNLYSYGPTNSVILMSSWEVWLLRAEAEARYGNTNNEVIAFNNAIYQSFNALGLKGANDLIASLSYNSSSSLDERIDQIGIQKWISMNGTQEDEAWIETRRFDRPASRLFTKDIF